ncbi:MAG: hypothetical protein JZU45_16640 [Methyloversatilis discipulorum]|uniref:hypothetical protein n=1 Tax=Methyloversatilis discipulorum TaxID=1119528 RepID=UPI0026EA1480|nr:hypothetical protein [Methyloversatilis discipulorum]MBV5287709.1 hypothetical protein [Methyloversatilis discipulorum]
MKGHDEPSPVSDDSSGAAMAKDPIEGTPRLRLFLLRGLKQNPCHAIISTL